MKLPDKVFGINTQEAYKKYLEDSGKRKPDDVKKPKIIPNNVQGGDKYIILPENKHESYEYPDLLVSVERSHNGENWNQAHESLRQESLFMLTLRQYADFLNLLKSGKAFDGNGRPLDKSRLDSVLDDIMTVRNPYRAEWLDAKFDCKGILKKQFHITYHIIKSNGALEKINEPLNDYLAMDKPIDLKGWLRNANYQGFPASDTADGNLYYWHPRNGRVAGFDAGSGGAGLCCDGDPAFSDSGLGVRAVKIKT